MANANGPTPKQESRKNLLIELSKVFDRETERGADWVASLLPDWAKSPLFERMLGPLAGWIESKTDPVKSPILGMLVEKLGDFTENIGRSIGEQSKGGGKTSSDLSWVKDFQKSATTRLQAAKNTKAAKDVFVQLKKELQLRIRLADLIREKTQQPATAPRKITIEDLRKFKQDVRAGWKEIEPELKALDRLLASRVKVIADWTEGLPGAKKGGKGRRIQRLKDLFSLIF